ncbi:hypothetical protein TNIN_24861 [Trichonephila inaurata madagascariensis]|uniref:Uncharacterized protein n=1 Tax=Trichonephila inaurata madagascariensis TaxID=2747483 RepID=A0A8X6Y5Q2_9ARAC|nr:hypothetical protein TNIN_80141 [Trichonephila inaurata madagascariensis]GFY64648.1 hypothetical protein TNIN_24861 [Trichonephila inaurata madagascariensis]
MEFSKRGGRVPSHSCRTNERVTFRRERHCPAAHTPPDRLKRKTPLLHYRSRDSRTECGSVCNDLSPAPRGEGGNFPLICEICHLPPN